MIVMDLVIRNKLCFSQGIVQLIRWQMMPQSKLIDPNRWIYRFGHTLSMNDCLYSTTAKYVALVDLDEFIIPKYQIFHLNTFKFQFQNL